ALARGEMFPTLEVPWGYPAFLAVFYRAFGDRQWIPLVAQVLLNSTVPLMLYAAVRGRIGDREARVAALLVGVCSFNTVYASTQTSDSLGTVLFVAAAYLFVRAWDAPRARTFAAAGLVAGMAMQVRPSFLLLPFWLAGVWLLLRPRTAVRQCTLFFLAACVAVMPWVVR